MTIALKEPSLTKSIELWAKETKRSAEKVLETAVQAYFADLEAESIRTETQAFWGMHEDLKREYPQQHVAMYRGAVIDHDENISHLERRVRERYGMLPVLIASVDSPPPREIKWLGGHTDH